MYYNSNDEIHSGVETHNVDETDKINRQIKTHVTNLNKIYNNFIEIYNNVIIPYKRDDNAILLDKPTDEFEFANFMKNNCSLYQDILQEVRDLCKKLEYKYCPYQIL